MRNISFFKKLRVFLRYRRIIKDNELELKNLFNIRIDNAYRLYTVVNIPQEEIGEPYNLKKSDIDFISEKFIKEYAVELSKFLNSKDLGELYTWYDNKKVDKYAYLLVLGFSLFKSDVFYKNLYFRFIPITLLILGIISLFIFI